MFSNTPVKLVASLCLLFSLVSPWATAEQSIKSDKVTSTLLLDIANTEQGLVSAGWRGHVIVSNDSGETWEQKSIDTRFTLTAMDFPTAKKGWIVGHNSLILHSDDGGNTWIKQHEDLESQKAIFDVWFKDENTGWAVGSWGLALHTTDGGKNWQDISEAIYNPDGYHYYGITGHTDGTLYIVGEREFTFNGGLVFQSKDWGVTWTQLAPPSPGTLFGTATAPDGTAYAYGVLGELHATRDQGESWKKIDLDTRDTVSYITFIGHKLVGVGSKGLTFTSKDGYNFHRWYEKEHFDFTSILPIDNKTAWVTGPKGIQQITLQKP